MPKDAELPLQPNASGVDGKQAPDFLEPPRNILGAIRHLGPGLIITGSIVGSGELIVTTGLGAAHGFTLLWMLVLGCLLKVFLQVELGRFTVSEGTTTLQLMNEVPGPRWGISWLFALWLIMFMSLAFQLAGITDACAEILGLSGMSGSRFTLSIAVAASGIALLASGRYRIVESLSTFMVFSFTACTLTAVIALQWTDKPVRASDLISGFGFHMPSEFVWAFAAFGITGVGASELIYYPYWCLEKGYARHVGPKDGSAAWEARAKGWLRILQFDAWTSFVVYTTATIAFYILGAAILHPSGQVVSDKDLVPTLSRIYEETFGDTGRLVFLVGAFFVLYSTFFVATGSNARLLADALRIFGWRKDLSPRNSRAWVRAACIGFPLLNLAILRFWGPQPVSLVKVGALTQATLLPFLSLLALHVRFQRTDPRLRPGFVWTLLLCLAAAACGAVGIYQLASSLGA